MIHDSWVPVTQGILDLVPYPWIRDLGTQAAWLTSFLRGCSGPAKKGCRLPDCET